MVQQAPELGWGPDDDYEMIQSKSFINTRFASDSDSSDSEDENSNVQLRDDEGVRRIKRVDIIFIKPRM